MTYKDEVVRAMNMLAGDERVIFCGQTALYSGSPIYGTLEGVPRERRLEIPVMEDCQMGMSIGLALAGYIPVSLYPRFDFLIVAMNQLVNHLDKINRMSLGRYNPKVIVRTLVGSSKPLYPGLQHCQDYTVAMRKMLKYVDVSRLEHEGVVVPTYKRAIESDWPSLIIEMADLY